MLGNLPLTARKQDGRYPNSRYYYSLTIEQRDWSQPVDPLRVKNKNSFRDVLFPDNGQRAIHNRDALTFLVVAENPSTPNFSQSSQPPFALCVRNCSVIKKIGC